MNGYGFLEEKNRAKPNQATFVSRYLGESANHLGIKKKSNRKYILGLGRLG
jgi:hypothetical protein